MQGFAEWITSRRYRAVLATAALGMASVFAVLSAAIVALITLRHGPFEATVVSLAAALAVAVAGLPFGLPPSQVILLFGAVWLPAQLLADLLRRSRSLALVVQAAVLGGVFLVIAIFAVVDDSVGAWMRVLTELGPALAELAPGQDLAPAARLMTGIMVSLLLLPLICAVLLARWWEASLVDPGAFGREFRALRSGVVMTGIAAAILVGAVFSSIVIFDNIAIVLVVAFFFQGLAVVHALAVVHTWHLGWLIAFYIVLVAALPYTEMLVAGLGFADNILNFRARSKR